MPVNGFSTRSEEEETETSQVTKKTTTNNSINAPSLITKFHSKSTPNISKSGRSFYGNGNVRDVSTPNILPPIGSRPPFITTVTRGKFLPSKFDLMVEKSLFTFSSRPRVLGGGGPIVATKHQCDLFSKPLREHNSSSTATSSSSSPRGAHDYYNMMYDPHIHRGRPNPKKKAENELENHREVKRVIITKRAATTTSSTTSITCTNTSNTRYKISIKSKSTTGGRGGRPVQTDQYLEDLSGDLSPQERDAVVQTDDVDYWVPINPHQEGEGDLAPQKSGVDISTQVLPGELISFDEEVEPIVETLVGKVLQLALMETMEEEELYALREQKNRFLEKRREEEEVLRGLKEDQKRLEGEKERLKLQLKMEEEGIMLEQALCSAASTASVPTPYLIELLPSVLNSLRQEGYLVRTGGGKAEEEDEEEEEEVDADADGHNDLFIPLWQKADAEESGESHLDENYEDEDNDGGERQGKVRNEVSLVRMEKVSGESPADPKNPVNNNNNENESLSRMLESG